MDILVAVALGAVCLLLLYKYLTRNFNFWKQQGVSGPKPIPLFGTSLDVLKSKTFTTVDPAYRENYGKIVGLFDGPNPSLLVSDPEFLRKAFIKEFNSMPNRRYTNMGGISNLFLSTLTDSHWKHVRSSLTPTFTTGKLKQMKGLIDSCCTRLISCIEKTTGKPFDVKEVCGAFTIDTICSTAFGIEVDSHDNPNEPIVKHAKRIINTANEDLSIWEKLKMAILFASFFVLPAKALNVLGKLGITLLNAESLSYFVSLTDQILKARSTEDSYRKDFVQLCKDQLIEVVKTERSEVNVDDKGNEWSEKGLTRDEIVANGILFFLAGYDTTANTLQFILYELALNPECQHKVYEDIVEYCTSSTPTYEQLSKMEYLDWVIEESMRIYPAVFRVERLVERDVEIDGIKLPKGTIVAAAIYSLHRDPDFWPEPEKFDPERHSPSNKEGRHQLAWIPFGIGNRNCIGMRLALLEMKLVIVNILKEFELEKCDATPTGPQPGVVKLCLKMDNVVPVTLGVVCMLLLYKYLTRNFHVWKQQGVRGPKPLPLFGNSLDLLRAMTFSTVDLAYRHKYGRLVGTFNGSTPQLLVSDPEFLRKAFVKEFSSMPNRREATVGGISNLFLMLLNDDHWRHVRISITPTFTTGKLKQMKGLIDSCCSRLVDHLKRTAGEPFNVKVVGGNFALDVISSTAFGIQVDSHSDPNDPVAKHAKMLLNNDPSGLSISQKVKLFVFFLAFFTLPVKLLTLLTKLGFSVMDGKSLDYFANLTDQILKGRSTEDSDRKDFVQLCKDRLIEIDKMDKSDVKVDDKGHKWSEKGLTRDEILAGGVVFFFAGHETTANTLQFLLYELAMNPEWQDKIYEEIMEFSTSSTFTYEQLSRMECLDWVIEETLRLYPPVPRAERQIAQDVEVDGIKLRRGSLVVAAIYSLHHDPEIWPDPEKFDPERHSPSNKEGRHPLAWIPFGVGNRQCIGMRLALLEIKLALVNVLRELKLEQCDATPLKPIKFKRNFQSVSEIPIKLVAVKRQ